MAIPAATTTVVATFGRATVDASVVTHRPSPVPASVMALMVAACHHLHVFGAVVPDMLVAVVNHFVGQEGATDRRLCHQNVFIDTTIAPRAWMLRRVGMPIGRLVLALRVIALAGTLLAPPMRNRTSGDNERFSAESAGTLDTVLPEYRETGAGAAAGARDGRRVAVERHAACLADEGDLRGMLRLSHRTHPPVARSGAVTSSARIPYSNEGIIPRWGWL